MIPTVLAIFFSFGDDLLYEKLYLQLKYMFKMTDNELKSKTSYQLFNPFQKIDSRPSDSSWEIPTKHHRIIHYALPTFGITQRFPWPNTT